jgi:hypothetical protein
MVNLESYVTEDNLVPTSHLQWKDGCLYLENSHEQVYVEPRVQRVFDYLRDRKDLWEVAQIKVHTDEYGLLGAPIFGVPFDVALSLLSEYNSSQSIVKSMFQRTDDKSLFDARLGVVATLVAHLSRSRPNTADEVLLSLEAWEIMNVDAETFYIHGLFSIEKRCFIHLDGATMFHDDSGKQFLFQQGNKVKGYNYRKHFRLDGVLDINTVKDLVTAFLPLEDLTTEYVLTHQQVNNA